MTRQAQRGSTLARSQGFTLVEMLVVITIIGILVGLLMPALISARNRARIADCSNNQRNLGSALAMYENDRTYYPGYVEAVGMGAMRTAASWQVMITPQLGRGDIWKWWQNGLSQNPTAGTVNTYTLSQMPDVAAFRCPSDTGRGQTFVSSYVVNCGLQDEYSSNSSSPPGGVPANGTPVDCSANGIFQNHFDGYILPSYQCKVSMSDIKKGSQQTILLSENLQAGNWTDPNPIPAAGGVQTVTSPSATSLQKLEMSIGMVWYPSTTMAALAANSPYRINSQKNDQYYSSNNITPYYNTYNSSGSANTLSAVARPSSSHPGGVVMTFCDSHTQFVRQDIEYLTYCLLMVPDNANCRPVGTAPKAITYYTGNNPPYSQLYSATLSATDYNSP